MANHDPMDLEVRSQAFYRDFYQFHKNSCDAWYIKDANHRYVDASITFLSRFVPSERKSIVGLSDRDLILRPESDLNLMLNFENQVLASGNPLKLLTIEYFRDTHKNRCHIVELHKTGKCERSNILFFIRDLKLEQHNIISVFFPGALSDVQIKSELSDVISRYSGVMPQERLTAVEWDTVWILIAGMTVREAAVFFNVSRKAIEKRLSNVYFKLRIFNFKQLQYVASKLNWIQFIPDVINNHESVIHIK